MSSRHMNPAAGPATGPAESRRDAWLGAIFSFFGAALLLWIIPSQVRDAGSFGLPPSFAPRVLGWVILGFGLLLFAANARSLARVAPGRPAVSGGNLVHLGLTVGSVAAMLLVMKFVGDRSAMPFAGFLVAAPLGLVAFTRIHSGAPLWAYAVNAIAVPVVVYLVLWLGLSLPLP